MSNDKTILQEIDETIIHICHLLQNVKSTDGLLIEEYVDVVRALASLTEARAHLGKEEPQPSYIPLKDTQIDGITINL